MNNDHREKTLDLRLLTGFIDGTLTAKETDRVIDLLMRDEQAFELFSETLLNILAVESPTDTGPGEGFWIVAESTLAGIGARSPQRRTEMRASEEDSSAPGYAGSSVGTVTRPVRRSVLQVLAAAAVLFAVLGYIVSSLRPGDERVSVELDALIARTSLTDVAGSVDPALFDHGWLATRGSAPGLNEQRRAFRMGVLVVDLQVALLNGQPELAASMTYSIQDLLEGVDLAEPLTQSYEALRLSLPEGAYVELSELNASTARLIEDEVDSRAFRFGQWSETSRLVSLLQDDGYFTRLDFQRELDFFARDAGTGTRRTLERVRTLTRTAANPRALERIAQVLDTVVRTDGAGL